MTLGFGFGGRLGKPVERALKNTMEMELFRSGEMASKYHQSQDVRLTPEIWGPSRLVALERRLTRTSPVIGVEGMVVVVP